MKDCWFTFLLPTNQEKRYSLFLDVAGLVESWPFTRGHHSYPTRKDEEPKEKYNDTATEAWNFKKMLVLLQKGIGLEGETGPSLKTPSLASKVTVKPGY